MLLGFGNPDYRLDLEEIVVDNSVVENCLFGVGFDIAGLGIVPFGVCYSYYIRPSYSDYNSVKTFKIFAYKPVAFASVVAAASLADLSFDFPAGDFVVDNPDIHPG